MIKVEGQLLPVAGTDHSKSNCCNSTLKVWKVPGRNRYLFYCDQCGGPWFAGVPHKPSIEALIKPLR